MTLMTKEMEHQQNLQEIKQHGAVWFPFNIYPCTIPKDFPQVALHGRRNRKPTMHRLVIFIYLRRGFCMHCDRKKMRRWSTKISFSAFLC